ncbi:MAG: hypothetical protein MJ071_09315 [Oscillospiraceae bacterium]|nr:hypothetical protein [Oscillospiraceae bacterium]
MDKLTIDNLLGSYPYWLCCSGDFYKSKELLQFTCQECDIPIEKIVIDEDGIHYFVEDGEVDNKGFYFLTEQVGLDFIDKNCKAFNDMKIHADDPIFSDGEMYRIKSAIYDIRYKDIRIRTRFRDFFFSELGKNFSFKPPEMQ